MPSPYGKADSDPPPGLAPPQIYMALREVTADWNPPFHRYLENWKIFTNFADADRTRSPGPGTAGGMQRHNLRKRLSALILDTLKCLANVLYLCQGLGNGRCPWICYTLVTLCASIEHGVYIYCVGLLRCRPT